MEPHRGQLELTVMQYEWLGHALQLFRMLAQWVLLFAYQSNLCLTLLVHQSVCLPLL